MKRATLIPFSIVFRFFAGVLEYPTIIVFAIPIIFLFLSFLFLRKIKPMFFCLLDNFVNFFLTCFANKSIRAFFFVIFYPHLLIECFFEVIDWVKYRSLRMF